MIPRRGDIYECPQCGLRIQVIIGSHFPPLLEHDQWVCSCGEKLILLQSGSESVAESDLHAVGTTEHR